MRLIWLLGVYKIKHEIKMYKDIRLCVSGQERHKTHSVLFTGSGKFLISTTCILETTQHADFFQIYIFVTVCENRP